MTNETPRKATAEQHINDLIAVTVYGPAGSGTEACANAWEVAKLIADLRARVQALEATQHAHVDLSHLSDAEREAAMNELRAASAEVRPAAGESEYTDAEWAEIQRWNKTDDASPAPASSLVKRRPLRCPTPATIAECGGPCEQGFYLCDCGLLEQLNPELRGPAPASSLVGRVAGAMGPSSQAAMDAGELPYGSACAAIREVAVAARHRGGQPLTWEHVAQWLEQEADR